jgi:PIN domain nuclease of toxin-antitoxin system
MVDRVRYVTDTHSLLWYLHSPKRLGTAAAEAFAKIAANGADMIVPIIVIAEILYILQAGRVAADFDEILARLQASANIAIVPLTLERVLNLRSLAGIPEMHDRMIAAEAQALGATLITRDETLRESSLVPTIW